MDRLAIHKIIRENIHAPKPDILVAIADRFTEALGRRITVDDLIASGNQLPRAVETSQSLFESADWMHTDVGGPVTDADFIAVPSLGDIPHGDLVQVSPADIAGYEPVHKRELGKGRFFLRARGDSMEPLILDSDQLLIEPGGSVESQNYRCRSHGQTRNVQTTPSP